jgi:hypothetical protein
MSDFQIAVRPLDKEAADAMRIDIVRTLLENIVSGLKSQISWIDWLNCGYVELEDLVMALSNGSRHPALLAWESSKNIAGHPAPSARELYARRAVTLLCTALERAEMSKQEACEFAASKLDGIFDRAPSERTIRYWQAQQPEPTRAEELLMAGGFAASGGDPDRLAIYFVALCHLALNPSAVAVAKNPPDYFGRSNSP